MMMPWRTRAPAMTLSQPVHIGYGHRASHARAHSLAQVLDSHHIAMCCPGMPFLQERLFLVPPEQRPTSPAAAFALHPGRPTASVCANPFLHVGLRYRQERSNCLHVKARMMGHPDGQTPLIPRAIGWL